MTDRYYLQADDEEAIAAALDVYARYRLEHPAFMSVDDSSFSRRAAAISIGVLAAERIIDPSVFSDVFDGIERMIGDDAVHKSFITQKRKEIIPE